MSTSSNFTTVKLQVNYFTHSSTFVLHNSKMYLVLFIVGECMFLQQSVTALYSVCYLTHLQTAEL